MFQRCAVDQEGLFVSDDGGRTFEKRNDALNAQLQAQLEKPIALLTGALHSNEAAMLKVGDAMTRVGEKLQELADVGSAEHAQMLAGQQRGPRGAERAGTASGSAEASAG